MHKTNIHIPSLGGSNAFTRTLSKEDVKICVAVEEAFTEAERCSEEKVSHTQSLSQTSSSRDCSIVSSNTDQVLLSPGSMPGTMPWTLR